MARNFDGTNDDISFGSDASVDNFATRTHAFWMIWDASGVADNVFVKSANGTTSQFGIVTTSGNLLNFSYSWSAASPAAWNSTATINGTVPIHIVVTYDNGSVLNDPVMYINNVSDTVVETTAPTVTANSDAANSLRVGQDDAGSRDFAGRLQNVCYDNTIWDAAQANRHYWHGRPGGAVVVLQPLYTTKLANEGTGTADGTATGTTMTSLPRGSRPGCGVF